MTSTKRKLAEIVAPNEENDLSASDYDKIVALMKSNSYTDEESGCIIVNYRLSDRTAKIDYNKKSYRCHVIAFEALCNNKEKKSDHQFVIHTCKQMSSSVRNCINPSHLTAVGKKEFTQLQGATPEIIARVKLVKQMAVDGKSVEETCKATGMKKTAVYDIRKGVSWTVIK